MLYERGRNRAAKALVQTRLCESGVVNDDEGAVNLTGVMQGHSVDVEGSALDDPKIADARVELNGAGGLWGASRKGGGETGGNGDGLSVGVIDSNAGEVLALAVTLDDMI